LDNRRLIFRNRARFCRYGYCFGKLATLETRITELEAGTAVEALTVGEDTFRFSSLSTLYQERERLEAAVEASLGGTAFHLGVIDGGI